MTISSSLLINVTVVTLRRSCGLSNLRAKNCPLWELAVPPCATKRDAGNSLSAACFISRFLSTAWSRQGQPCLDQAVDDPAKVRLVALIDNEDEGREDVCKIVLGGMQEEATLDYLQCIVDTQEVYCQAVKPGDICASARAKKRTGHHWHGCQ